MNSGLLLIVAGVTLPAILLQAAFENWFDSRKLLPVHTRPIAAWGTLTLIGYAVFWAYFAAPWLGGLLAASVYVAGAGYWIVNRRAFTSVFKLNADGNYCRWILVCVMMFYLGALLLWKSDKPVDDIAANRFIPSLPPDNQIPRLFAERLDAGLSPKNLIGDWLSSDRPPLQTGAILLFRAPLHGAQFWPTSFGASLLFQLIWIPGLWALLRGAGASLGEVALIVALTCLTGFCLIHSVYTWPKLGAAGLILGGASLLLEASEGPSIFRVIVGAALCALANLAHGGVAFSLLALAPFALLRVKGLNPAALAAAAFLLISLPWTCYQHFYEPPGNRLLKWHVAGSIPIDNRGLSETLTDNYRSVGWNGAWGNKKANATELFSDGPQHILEIGPASALSSRCAEFFHFFRGLGVGSWLLLASPWFIWRYKKVASSAELAAHTTMLIAWAMVTLLCWTLLMFGPATTLIHQGSLAPLLILWAVPLLLVVRWKRCMIIPVAIVQFVLFFSVWLASTTPVVASLASRSAVLGTIGALMLVLVAVLAQRKQADSQSVSPSNSVGLR